MSSDVLQVADRAGNLLDAHVSLRKEEGDRASLIFESQGAGRNRDYFKAYDLVIGRLAQLSATLLDGLVVSGDTKDLPEQDRRFLGADRPSPIFLAPNVDTEEVARLLRRGAAGV